MSDTVLDIGYKLSDDVGIPRYTNLVGNSEQNARKILTSIKDGLDNDVFIDRDWEMLTQPASVTELGAGVTTYALPADFDRIVNDTIWDQTNYNRVRGPVDVREWQEYLRGYALLSGIRQICRIQSDLANNLKVLTFYPDTSASTVVSYFYISNKAVVSSGGVAKATITADDDGFVVPHKAVRAAAKWRLLRSLGMSFQDELAEYQSLIEDLSANDSGAKKVRMSRHVRYDIAHVPDVGYGS